MRRVLPILIAASVASCSEGGNGTGIDDRVGAVRGTAYVDRDADGQRTLADAPAAGVRAAVVLESSGDTVASTSTNLEGAFLLPQVPIGRYRLVADRGTLGDSVGVVAVSNSVFNVTQADTIPIEIRLGYPTLTAAQMRALPPGRRAVFEGVALNGWATFADSTVHVNDPTGAVRVVRSQPSNVQAGDAIRVLGTTGVRDGQPVIADATLRILSANVGMPQPDSVSTAAAASADGGDAADGQVRIAGAIIQDTARSGSDLILGVNDGSGRLEVVLDGNIAFGVGPYVPGATFSGRGVLVVAPGGGSWRLKPRDRDEAVISFPTVTIVAARAMEAGRRVTLQGVSLNSWTAFGDSTVHLADATGTIRAVRVLAPVAAGDSVRLLGTTGARDGQPVLTNVTPTLVRANVGIAAPDSISTGAAALAVTGTRDAALVRIAGTIIAAQTMPNGDRILGVDDGSGRLDVVLDVSGVFTPAPYEPGALLLATGLLVPTGTGVWQLKPRTAPDVTATYPTVSVAEARALPVGKTVFVRGIALNGWITFGDSTVHVADQSAAIRVLRIPPTTLFAGDSVRMLGTVAVRNAQPVLIAGSAAVLQAGAGLPSPDSLSTAAAAAATGGRDASQVAVWGTISTVTPNGGGNLIVTISDGSGNLRVVLDVDVGFPTSGFQPGRTIRARGVLVPDSTGSTWELKPRTLGEVVFTN